MDDLDLQKNIWEIMHTVKSRIEKLITPIAHEEGLTPHQIFVLLAIKRGKVLSVGDLVRIAGINQGNASTICKKLEIGGFVDRKRSHEDERVVSLFMTNKGQQALGKINRKIQGLIEILDEYPKDKLQAVYHGFFEFDAILKQIEEQVDKQDALSS